jgi:hypothetical protein
VFGAMEKAHYIRLIKEKTGLSEESIIADLKSMESVVNNEINAYKNVEIQKNASSQFDSITRKLLGLLYYLEKNKELGIDIESYRNKIKDIINDKYDNLISNIEPYKDELILEAEVTYGGDTNFNEELSELLINFEDNVIREEFAQIRGDAKDIDANKLNDLIKRRSNLEKRKLNLYKK